MKENWMFPANVKSFDLVDQINRQNKVYWKYSSKINIGDTVYIYAGQPMGKMAYKCSVIETNIPFDFIKENAEYALPAAEPYRFKYLLLKPEKDLRNISEFAFKELKANGLGQVQRQTRVNRELLAFLTKYEEKANEIN